MKKNTVSEKGKKSNNNYGIKVAMAASLGVLLICGIVAIGILLFSDLFTIEKSSFNKNYPVSDNKDSLITVDEGSSLVASYDGPQLYTGGQAVRDYFTVELVDKNGNRQTVEDAECDMLSASARLVEGDNDFVFTYKGMKTSVTVKAVNIRTLLYAPDYILTKVDEGQATAKADSILAGEISHNDALADVVFTGDSQIKALTSYEIISPDRVVAKVGESYDYFEQNFNRILEMASGKKAIIVHYGINTLNVSSEVRAQRIAQYKDILTRLKQSLPDLRIIVSGVYPVSNSIVFAQQRFWYINEYDFALCEMCMELGIEYLSDNAYMDAHQEVFSGDGLHLTKQFYTNYWLANAVKVMGL